MWLAQHRTNHAQRQDKSYTRLKSPKTVKGRLYILAPNRVNREFTVDASDLVWVTDIISIRT